jgi:pimeloyl-ACP methyl ester carboxylesterase
MRSVRRRRRLAPCSMTTGLAFVLLCAVGLPSLAPAGPQAGGSNSSIEPRPVRLTTRDGGTVHGDLYGSGIRGLVLAHGGRLTKESWAKQVPELLGAGFRVLAVDFRGFGESRAGAAAEPAHHYDVLAAVHYLRKEGATTVAVIGGSFGGVAAAAAAVAEPGSIDRLVLLGATPEPPDEALVTRKLYITTRDDANAAGLRLPGLQTHFAKAPEPKELIVLPGSAHAQFMFDSDLASHVMREILRFLAAP